MSSAACPPIWSRRPLMPPRPHSLIPTCAHVVCMYVISIFSVLGLHRLVPDRHCPTFPDGMIVVCPMLQGGLVAGRRASECCAVAVLAMHTQAGHSPAVCGTSHCGRMFSAHSHNQSEYSVGGVSGALHHHPGSLMLIGIPGPDAFPSHPAQSWDILPATTTYEQLPATVGPCHICPTLKMQW